MRELDDGASEESCDDAADQLLRNLARTPVVARFTGTDRFRVVSCLGEGGFGVVYEVDDRQLGRRVALKTLKLHRSGFAASVLRLKREFRSVADLVHPNLVGLHELSTDGTRWFFTMELVRGVNVLEFVRRDERRLRPCLAQLVAGVAALHDAGMVHRDLKPSNVLVEPGGRVVILDFGLSDGGQPADGDLLGAGTPIYMAPEAADGAVGPAADWWAVGVMLYEALTGCQLVDELPAAGPPAPSARRPVPADLEALCMALLRRDPGARPDAAAIRAALGAGSSAADRPEVELRRSRGRFVGRTAELSVLRSAHAAIQRGEPTLLRLHGEAGVGKSTLLGRFADVLRADGRTAVLSGRCHEREAVPFKAFDRVMDALARYLHELPRSQAAGLLPRDIHLVAQLFPVLEGLPALRDIPRRQADARDPREVRARAFAALKELVARIADKQPLVITIDDLQWGDMDSARLLAQLVTPPDRPAALVVLVYRSDEAESNSTLRETLDTIEKAGAGGDEIALAPLPPADAEELARSLLDAGGPPDASLARAIAERGEGHPLFIAELARAQLVPGAADGRPPSLLDILWQRVAQLSTGARALVETLAVAGRPVPRDLCFEAAGLGDSDIDVVRVLRAEQMVRAGDHGDINVFHDRVRDAVLLRSDAGTRRRRHLALARALERRPEADLEALARHFDAADQHEQAVRYAVRAADAAIEGLAFERAASLYRVAIDRGGGSAELYEKLGAALLDAGRSVAAGEAFLAAAGRVQEGGRRKTDLTRLAAEHMLVVGNAVAGLDVLRRALADVGEEIPRDRRQVMRLLIGHQVVARLRKTRFRRREEAALAADELLRLDVLESAYKGLEPTDSFVAMGLRARHYRRAIRVGEPRRAARAMVAGAAPLFAYCRSLPPVVDHLLDAADDIGDELGDPEILGRSLAARGTSRFYFADWAAGAELSERAASLIAERCRGMASEQHHALMVAAMCHLRGGRFDRARRVGETLLLGAIEREDLVHRKQVCAGVLAPLRLAAGDVDGARRLLEETGDEPRCPSVVTRAESLAAIAQYCGEPRAALETWRARWPRLLELGVMTLVGLRVIIARSFGGALIVAGDDRRDQREAARLERAIRRVTLPASLASHALLRAQRAAREGRSERAAASLAQAASLFDDAGMPHDAAACRRRRGELVGGDEGAREVSAADERLRSMGIADPARWSATVAPPVARSRRLLVE